MHNDGLYSHSNSSWADDPDDWHSTSGYVYLLADAVVSWCLCKQKTAAQSFTKAKYMQLADAGNQAMWYHMFLEELGYEVTDPIPIIEDNQSVVNLAENPITGHKSKHILLKFHIIRNYVKNTQVNIIRTPSKEVLADGLTKPFMQIKLTNFMSGLGLI